MPVARWCGVRSWRSANGRSASPPRPRLRRLRGPTGQSGPRTCGTAGRGDHGVWGQFIRRPDICQVVCLPILSARRNMPPCLKLASPSQSGNPAAGLSQRSPQSELARSGVHRRPECCAGRPSKAEKTDAAPALSPRINTTLPCPARASVLLMGRSSKSRQDWADPTRCDPPASPVTGRTSDADCVI